MRPQAARAGLACCLSLLAACRTSSESTNASASPLVAASGSSPTTASPSSPYRATGASTAPPSGGAAVNAVSGTSEILATLARLEDARRLPRPVVEQLASSPDVVVRRRTMWYLARLARAETLGPLRSALTDTDETTRAIALFGLGQVESGAHADAERVLRAFLELAPQPPARGAALAALGRVGSPESLPTLLEGLDAASPELRATSARALGFFALRGLPLADATLVALASRLRDPGGLGAPCRRFRPVPMRTSPGNSRSHPG